MSGISEEALELAAENRERLGLDETQASFRVGDLFEAVEGTFDLVVANLPYIAAAEIGELSAEVQNDPESALDGGESGTELMERFLDEAWDYLNPGGVIAMEFGEGQAAKLTEVAEDAGFESVEIRKDAGGLERFLFAVKPAETG